MLLVIDMQKPFEAARDESTQDAIISLVKKAKANRERIIYLEYVGCGPTLERITAHTEKYPFVTKVEKSGPDGSYELDEYFQGIYPNTLDVVGVDTGFCVKDTIEGLVTRAKKTKINLHLKGCNHPHDPDFTIDSMYIDGVNVIS